VIHFVTAFLLIVLGVYAFLSKKNLIKLILALDIVDSGIHLLLISFGYRIEANEIPTAPIYPADAPMVGPLPQALVLTSIVIGVCVLSLAVALTINAYRHYGTLDVRALRRLRG